MTYDWLTKSETMKVPGLPARLRTLTSTPAEESGLIEFLDGPPLQYEWVVLATNERQHVCGWAALFGALRYRFYADLFVDPAYRGQGIGRHLFEEVKGRAEMALIVSDTPFYRHLAPEAEAYESSGLNLLRIQCHNRSD